MVLELIRDVQGMSEPPFIAQCLLCPRKLLMSTSLSSVTVFRTSGFTEIFCILGQHAQSLDTKMSLLHFLDVVTVQAPQEYGYQSSFLFVQDDELAVFNGGGGDDGFGHLGDGEDGDQVGNGLSLNDSQRRRKGK